MRRRPTPGSRGPERQVGGVGLSPNRHPPEVIVALAAHLTAFVRGSAPAPALIRPRAHARRAPEGRPDPGGRRLHDTLGATRQGQFLRRVVCKCLRVPSSQDAQGRAESLAPTPRAAAATPESLRLALSPDAAARAAGSGYRHPLLSGPITGRSPRAPRARPVGATAAAASSSLPGSSPGRAVPPGASRAAPPSLSPPPPASFSPPPPPADWSQRGAHLPTQTWRAPKVSRAHQWGTRTGLRRKEEIVTATLNSVQGLPSSQTRNTRVTRVSQDATEPLIMILLML